MITWSRHIFKRQCTMWVRASHPFNLAMIAKAIIQGTGRTSPADSSEWNNALHQTLCASVKGKRFLLVLDDVQTDEPNNFNPLKHLLNEGADGSRILLTTRNENIAHMTDSYKHFLGVLSFDDCLSLLCHKAFVGSKQEASEISIEIAKKCKGLPLAANLLGSLLSQKKTEKDWRRRVLESSIWELNVLDQETLFNPALLLSYGELPSPLKRCFAYCALFPKDHKIEKDTLIKMWMAEGLLNSTETRDLQLELIGEDYFNDLAAYSFLEDFSTDDDGSITHCKMQDHVHDLAQYLTKNECHVKHHNGKFSVNDFGIARHLTLVDPVASSSFHESLNNKVEMKLRTLNVSILSFKQPIFDSLHHLILLRVLDLKGMNISQLPNEIEKLIHLRYLDLSNNKNLKELPDSLSSLYNLQTLNLKGCLCLRKLPKRIGNMINLRHLNITQTRDLECIPEGIGRLKSLQTLSKFIVGDARGGCGIEELEDLDLSQELSIIGLGRLKTAEEASSAMLEEKHQLHDLTLNFDPSDAIATIYRGQKGNHVTQTMECVLGALRPHPNLPKLTILNYLGLMFPSWIASDTLLTNLRHLELNSCTNCTELPAFGLLPSLENLIIRSLPALERIGAEIFGTTGGHCTGKVAFPKLNRIDISAQNLEVWEFGTQVARGEFMPCVTTIIVNCERLKVLPALGVLPSLETLQIKAAHGVTHINREFCGIDDSVVGGVGRANFTAFPMLKTLQLNMNYLEVWELGDKELASEQIMPCLSFITLSSYSLKVLPPLGKLSSLETLEIKGGKVTHIGIDFYGLGDNFDSSKDGSSGPVNLTAFPKLSYLSIEFMSKLEVFDLGVGLQEEEDGNYKAAVRNQINVMPCLTKIEISECENLKTMRAVSKLLSLESLIVSGMENLEEIVEEGDEDTVLLLPCLTELSLHTCPRLESIPRRLPKLNKLHMYKSSSSSSTPLQLPISPNLTTLKVSASVVLPKGIAELKELQYLEMRDIDALTCIPEYVQDLTKLQNLTINGCNPMLAQRCTRNIGEEWSIISHIPNIFINRQKV